METERLERFVELWDKGLIEAAERAQKSPAKEGGETKYEKRGLVVLKDQPLGENSCGLPQSSRS